MKTLFIILLSLSFCYCQDLEQIRETLKEVETNSRAQAIGDNGRAYGILQIHKACIIDVNRYYGTNYKHKDAFNVKYSEEIFDLYIRMGIKLYKTKHCRDPTEKEIVQFWNFGIYQKPYDNGYYKRYLQFKKLIKKRM